MRISLDFPHARLIASQYDGYQMTGVREPISWTKYHNLATVIMLLRIFSQENLVEKFKLFTIKIL